MPISEGADVLLVDRDPEMGAVSARALRGAGFRVAEAHDGLHAFQKALAYPTDVVVTEVDIPGIDGCELCRRLRNTDRTSAVAIIAVADASTFLKDCERAEHAGANAVLARPYEPNKLVVEVRHQLGRAGAFAVRTRVASGPPGALVRQAGGVVCEEMKTIRGRLRRLRGSTTKLRQFRTAFHDLPGLWMTPQEGARFSNLDVDMCRQLLDRLVDEKFLIRTRDGRYKRA